MSVKITTEVVGMRELEKALKDLRAEMGGKEGNIVANALRATSKDVEQKMKALVPVDTGRLRNAIFVKRDPRPRHLSELFHIGPRFGKTRADLNGAWYAAIVNFKGGKEGKGKGYMARSISPEFHAKMLQFEIAKRLLPKAKKIGLENAAAVAAAVKKANAAFAYKK